MIHISIVIPTFNRRERLNRVLDALEHQTYPASQFEAIVVSDGSTDGTNDYLSAVHKPFTVVPVIQANRGVAAARNCGIERASGNLILFLDDDVVPASQLIDEHVRHHTAHSNLVVLGPMLTPTDFAMAPWVRWEQAMLLKQYSSMAAGEWTPSPRQFYTGNASLARHHLQAVGGFDESFRRAEDVELAYRLAEHGLNFVFDPKAVGYHYAERSFRSWLEIPYTYGRNDVIFWRDKRQPWLLPLVARELRIRNTVIKLLVRGLTGRQRLTRVLVTLFASAAMLGAHLHLEHPVRMLYSSIFNVRYYQGIADELGGRDPFIARVLQG